MKRIIYGLFGLATLGMTSCSDFLETVPKDSLAPSTTWKTVADVDKFVVGCYEGWANSGDATLLYMDAGSDIAYNNFPWEGWTNIGNGLWTASNPGGHFYDYGIISRCNNVVDNIDKATIPDAATKNNLLGQALAIRAYQYMNMNFWYGGVPIVEHLYENAEKAKVPRNTEAQVWEFINKDIDKAVEIIAETPSARGRIAKGAALAIQMRANLYQENWQKAADAAKAIIDLGQYALEADYAKPFTLAGRTSKEIIVAECYDENKRSLYTLGQFYNNGDGGWSSVVPTQNLVDMYLMKDGQPKETSALYDATHPFANRDPRMAKTILYPGCDYWGGVYNTLDKTINGKTNPNYPTAADNASKTALTWAKYLYPMSQYKDMWATPAEIIVFRYAEVLLTRAEALNELNGPTAEVYDLIDQLRQRAGMPVVDRTAVATKEALRDVIRRERCVELAGEGLRRADIVRWKDHAGKMLAMTLLNGELKRITGTVDMAGSNPETRATIATQTEVIETRIFKEAFRRYPIPQDARDKNPELIQNDGF